MTQNTRTHYEGAVETCLKKIDANIPRFDEESPHVTENGTWRTLRPDRTAKIRDGEWDHGNWTGGFWAGVLWLAYGYSGEDPYEREAVKWAEKFAPRRTDENTHDLGFVFYFSHVIGLRVGASREELREYALTAAETLTKRFHPKAGLLQSWGPVGHPELGGTSAIDTMMNLPLLWWAHEQTDRDEFHEIALRHARTSAREYLRPDGSTYHELNFDPDSGAVLDKTTFQGLSDDSCWSRGQAWGITGWAIAYRYSGEENLLAASEAAAEFYWDKVPGDRVPFWDFRDPKIPDCPRDSSAAAAAISGFLQLARVHPEEDRAKRYENWARLGMESLIEGYMSPASDDHQGILLHACYSKPHNEGVDSSVIWGDYFFLQNLIECLRGSPI